MWRPLAASRRVILSAIILAASAAAAEGPKTPAPAKPAEGLADDSITGTVVDPAGVPVAGCKVWLRIQPLDERREGADATDEAVSDSRGRFAFHPGKAKLPPRACESVLLFARDASGRIGGRECSPGCRLWTDAEGILHPLGRGAGAPGARGRRGRPADRRDADPARVVPPQRGAGRLDRGDCLGSGGGVRGDDGRKRSGRRVRSPRGADERRHRRRRFDRRLRLVRGRVASRSAGGHSAFGARHGPRLAGLRERSEGGRRRPVAAGRPGRASAARFIPAAAAVLGRSRPLDARRDHDRPGRRLRLHRGPAGQVSVRAAVSRRLSLLCRVVRPTFDVRSGETTSGVSLALRPLLSVRGTAVDEETGAAVPGVELTMHYPSPENRHYLGRIRSIRTDAQGAYSLRVAPGEVRVAIKAAPERYVTPRWDMDLLHVEVAQDAALPAVRLRRARTVEGVVVDASGKPVAGAEIIPFASSAFWEGHPRSDRDGKFLVKNLAADALIPLRARAGTAVTSEEVTAGPGDASVRLIVAEGNACCVRGSVVDETGQPVRDAAVALHTSWEKGDVSVGAVLAETRTDGQGGYWFGGLWPGDVYNVCALGAEGYERVNETMIAEKAIHGRLGQTVDAPRIVVSRLRGVVEGTTVDSAGRPLSGVAVFNAGDAPCARRHADRRHGPVPPRRLAIRAGLCLCLGAGLPVRRSPHGLARRRRGRQAVAPRRAGPAVAAIDAGVAPPAANGRPPVDRKSLGGRRSLGRHGAPDRDHGPHRPGPGPEMGPGDQRAGPGRGRAGVHQEGRGAGHRRGDRAGRRGPPGPGSLGRSRRVGAALRRVGPGQGDAVRREDGRAGPRRGRWAAAGRAVGAGRGLGDSPGEGP